MKVVSKVTPFVWFDTQAEAAMNYYVETFKNAKVVGVKRYGKGGPMPEGTVMTATFSLDGFELTLLNGGPVFQLTPGISFLVRCDDQAEVDRLWARLSDGGKPSRCGWVTDRFNVTWQVVPKRFEELVGTGDAAQAQRVFAAMMKMTKFDISQLEAAARG